uniref:BED-type domain-containing protein n=1 Tax=Ascaris lumbricoides TaxID=6252 RepID=A0A9J2P5G2_ASCLU
MLASTLTESTFQQDDVMTDTYADEHGSTVDSDADSAVDETTSQGSQSSERYSLGNEVSLMALLSSKSATFTDDKCKRIEHRAVLDTAPSTSTASTSHDCNVGYATAPSEGSECGARKEPFVEEAKMMGVTERNFESASPWMRNAGRKKSHPVWDFFKDLRAPDGSGGVICLHCNWKGDDRSPNNLKTHLKRFHEHDGIYKQFAAKLASVISCFFRPHSLPDFTFGDQRMERIISLGLLNLRKAVVNGWKTGEMDGRDEAASKSYVAFAKRRREVSRAIG